MEVLIMPKRNNNTVVMAKRILLAALVLIFIVLIISPYFSSQVKEDIEEVVLEKAEENLEKLITENPSFFGTDEGEQPFKIKAIKGYEIDSEHVKLTDAEVEVKTKNDGVIHVRCNEAKINLDNKIMNMIGSIVIKLEDGTVITTEQADYDIKSRVVDGKASVEISGETGVISAKSFRIENSYNNLILYGSPVKTKIYSSTAKK
jgi:LPS export ABC transporter protein LptC